MEFYTGYPGVRVPIDMIIDGKVVLQTFFADKSQFGKSSVQSRHIVPFGKEEIISFRIVQVADVQVKEVGVEINKHIYRESEAPIKHPPLADIR